MNDDELRSLIRAAIQKHVGGAAPESASAREISGELRRDRLVPVSISFAQYQLERAKDDTSCLIEPAVQCNHCGFCKCHGH
jgi:hypothetical protein